MEYFVFFTNPAPEVAGVHITIVYADNIVISRSQLTEFWKVIKSDNFNPCTPDDLCKLYEENSVRYENKFKHVAFGIRGQVARIHRGFFDEFIVELKCNESWVSDLAVICPSKIPEAMKNELMKLNIGDYFEALVVGRSSWYYVYIPFWNSNGTYRTEP